MSVSTFVRVIVLVALVLAMLPAASLPVSAAPAEVSYVTAVGSAYCASGRYWSTITLKANNTFSQLQRGRYYFLLPANSTITVYFREIAVGSITTGSSYTYGPRLRLPC